MTAFLYHLYNTLSQKNQNTLRPQRQVPEFTALLSPESQIFDSPMNLAETHGKEMTTRISPVTHSTSQVFLNASETLKHNSILGDSVAVLDLTEHCRTDLCFAGLSSMYNHQLVRWCVEDLAILTSVGIKVEGK